ncbi:hypothetical protein LG200_11875 [Methylobacillus caricis]|uniref:hypothetical protein n=1 Tax=Methylobacillus caricis TaxID=1971611 RepID=UPI001CFFD5E0|nr:hypothetical protein [Methylobacillus caricis]MCB5188697.1 hypothetical protein [Methylobacillus caricis]
MPIRNIALLRTLVLTLSSTFMLSGCGGFSLWPFGEDDAAKTSRGPAGSTEYQCDKGRKFYVRIQDGGNVAWLVLPDREVGLNKTEGAGQFSNGITTLAIEGDIAKLEDGYKHEFANCKVPQAAPKQ